MVSDTSSLLAYYRFDDGGSTVEDFAWPQRNAAQSICRAFARLSGGLVTYQPEDYSWQAGGVFDVATRPTSVDAMAPIYTAAMNRTVEETANTISKDIYIDDSNGDGLPDWFQALYGAAAATADTDIDGDGITAWNEYLGHTNPTKIDTDGNGEADGLDDSDSDGRTLADEQALGSYANLHDTDDDGVPDGADVAPVNALLASEDRSPAPGRDWVPGTACKRGSQRE